MVYTRFHSHNQPFPFLGYGFLAATDSFRLTEFTFHSQFFRVRSCRNKITTFFLFKERKRVPADAHTVDGHPQASGSKTYKPTTA